jgi:glycosyltransferase involved in cell wall biosynthesis
MTPRVSVIIPTYNNELYVRETMQSVLAQTFTDFELVVADHSSADGTWERLQEFTDDPRVRLLTTPAGGSAERNWNRVSKEASGELVKLVCGDDLLAPDALEKQVAAFDAHDEGVVMVASPRDIVDASGKRIMHNLGLGGLEGRVPGGEAIRRSVLRGANIFGEPCCVMVRRTALEEVGLWHGNPGYIIDQATYCRVLLRGDLATTPGPIAAFRISATQWSVALARQQARSAAEMHRQLREMSPGLLSRRDVKVGNAMAALRALQRRLFYIYLGRRMTPQDGLVASRQNSL